MKTRKVAVNPSRFNDMLEEGLFAKGDKGRDFMAKRENRINWLRKKGTNSPACIVLANKLDSCRPKHRCHSPACFECAHAAQRLLAKVTRRFLTRHAPKGTTVCVTVVPKDGTKKLRTLEMRDHGNAIRRWKEKLGKARVTWFVGATDWSFNEHAEGRYKPRWSVHFFGVTVTDDPKKLRAALKKQFPKTKSIPRPIKVVEWDGHRKALRYVLKPNFWRRVATDQAERYNKRNETTRLCRATDKQRLRSKGKRELLVHLDEVGLQSRLLFRWCQLINRKEKGPVIELRVPKGVGAKK